MNPFGLPDSAFYVARCHAYEWVLQKAHSGGRCGCCGVRPEKIGEYDGRRDWARRRA